MTIKEISAAVMVLSAIVFSVWIGWDATHGGLAATLPEAAWKMIWAIGYVIVFNIVAIIIGTILVSIVRREEVKDERADERDRLVSAKATQNGYLVLSVGVLAVLFGQAFGIDAVLGPYLLFGVSMLAGLIFAASQLVYYRIG
jgi:predicted membrane protein